MISVALFAVASERVEDPVVDGSHGRDEGGGVKDDDNNECHEGGGGRRQGLRQVVASPSSLGAAGAIAKFCIAVVAVGNDDGVHHPPEVRQHCRAGIPISPCWNVFIPLNGEGKGGGGGGDGGGGVGGCEGGGKG